MDLKNNYSNNVIERNFECEFNRFDTFGKILIRPDLTDQLK